MIQHECIDCNGRGKKCKKLPGEILILDELCPHCNGYGIDCRDTDELTCPYCGACFESLEFDNEGEHECSCGKMFMYSSETTRTFSSRQVPCLNGEKHKWKNIYDDLERGKINWHCEQCDTYRYRLASKGAPE